MPLAFGSKCEFIFLGRVASHVIIFTFEMFMLGYHLFLYAYNILEVSKMHLPKVVIIQYAPFNS